MQVLSSIELCTNLSSICRSYIFNVSEIAEQNSHIYDNAQQIPPPPPPRAATTSPDYEAFEPSPLSEIPGNNSLGVGSMVEVVNDVCDNLYGVIRWVGSVAYASGKSSIIVGVELEDDPGDQQLELSDGTYKGQRLFKCPPDRAIFVGPNQCLRDRRFHDDVVPTSKASRSSATETKMFGQVDCPIIEGAVAPLSESGMIKLRFSQLKTMISLCRFRQIRRPGEYVRQVQRHPRSSQLVLPGRHPVCDVHLYQCL
jgi:CAP-Gly domain